MNDQKAAMMKHLNDLNLFKIIEEMPDSEAEYISDDPQKAVIDIQIWDRCRQQGNFTAWEKLKYIRSIK